MLLGLVNALATAENARSGPLVHLLGRPYVSHASGSCQVAGSSTRLIAFLAVHRMDLDRRYVAGCLWPTVDEAKAAGNLRSALWRLKALEIPLLQVDNVSLRLREQVCVDVHLLSDWAARVISGNARLRDLSVVPWDLDHLDMLPGWYDDWVLLERERLRQRVFHALERLSREMVAQGRYAEAVESALVTVSGDPLRESGQRVLIEAHLAESNWTEAVRAYEVFRTLLMTELGVEPSAALAALVHPP